MKKLILSIALSITCLLSFSQTYTDGVAYRKTYDNHYKLKENVIYGTYVSVEVTSDGYIVSGHFGFGHDVYNLKLVKGVRYSSNAGGDFLIEDNLDDYNSFKMTYRSGKEIIEYNITGLKLEGRKNKLQN